MKVWQVDVVQMERAVLASDAIAAVMEFIATSMHHLEQLSLTETR